METCADHSHNPILEIFTETLVITGFILTTMLILEYLTILTRGKWSMPIKQNPFLQIITAVLLGLVPGCLGTYIGVSLFVHGIYRFPALLAVMIATTGDEAFLMVSMMPENYLLLSAILVGTAIVTALLYHYFLPALQPPVLKGEHLEVHEEERNCACFSASRIIPQLRNITFHRTLLIMGTMMIMVFLVFFGEQHGHVLSMENHFWDWKRILLLLVSLFGLFIVVTVSEHFLIHHLWEHIIRKHLIRIFLWTLAAIALITFALDTFHLEEWISDNLLLLMLVAALIGLIPISGPHILFVSLFIAGSIPFSILLTNSLVQDGHGALPLIAESKRSFFLMKTIKFVLALLIGFSGYLGGW
jgi:hypothetical protein